MKTVPLLYLCDFIIYLEYSLVYMCQENVSETMMINNVMGILCRIRAINWCSSYFKISIARAE